MQIRKDIEEMTARTKKHLTLIGIVITVGSVAGAITAVLIAWSTLKAKAQNEFVLPVVKEQVAIASKECREEIEENRKDRVQYQKEQQDINAKILDYLHRLDNTTTKLETEINIMNRRRKSSD